VTVQFKVDENLHEEIAALLRLQGHDAQTLNEQKMQGYPDTDIAHVCRREGRAIITLDMDFANILRYPLQDYPGIIVLRLKDQSRSPVFAVMLRLLPELATQPLTGLPVDRRRSRNSRPSRNRTLR